jgi:hypothetical protein
MTTTQTAAPDDARKPPRRTISENVDQNTPAYRVVQKAGGLAKFCEDFDFPTSTVHSWLAKRPGRPHSGLIPANTRHVPELDRTLSYTGYIIWRGRQLDPPVEYTAEDFVEDEEAI